MNPISGQTLEALVLTYTNRLPRPAGPAGSGGIAARQFDAVLMSAGFKCSGELLACLAGLSQGAVIDTAVRVLPAVREMVGEHRQHNVYFKNFPAHVPTTERFWMDCLADVLGDPALERAEGGVVSLLGLTRYGRYQHSYAEMLAVHDELVERATDRVTVVDLGGDLTEEVTRLYVGLAGRATPLNDADLRTLRLLAGHCADGPQPEAIPVRENRALINQVRLDGGRPLLIDTVTDVLRLACAVCGGDVTLQTRTRFASFTRPTRRALLAALDAVIAAAPAKLGDVAARREQWKRLGERLHPHEYPQWPDAARVFQVARGEMAAPSLGGRVETLLADGDVPGAARLLEQAPGLLLRSTDRLLRGAGAGEEEAVLAAVTAAAGRAPARVVLSLREHLLNRPDRPGHARVFANRMGFGTVVADARAPLSGPARERLAAVLDAEVRRRLPAVEHLVVDPQVYDVALPLSGKATAGGFGVLPRGSVVPVDGERLRFFMYWRQTAELTDYDLSALLLDQDFTDPQWISYTSLRGLGAAHSGDITSAPDGASEFIDVELGRVQRRVIIPQVNIFAGEGFDQVAESFVGFMLRDGAQKGRPFEPRTVRMKSELRGAGRVALPLAFLRGDDGRWRAKWLQVSLAGYPSFNRVETNRETASALVRAVAERRYLTVRYLADLWSATAGTVTRWRGQTSADTPTGGPADAPTDVPVTFIGLERPEGLHAASTIITPARWSQLIPA